MAIGLFAITFWTLSEDNGDDRVIVEMCSKGWCVAALLVIQFLVA